MKPRTTPQRRPSPAYHVELTQVPTAAPPFHALHGTVPVSPVPHLHSELEEGREPLGRHR